MEFFLKQYSILLHKIFLFQISATPFRCIISRRSFGLAVFHPFELQILSYHKNYKNSWSLEPIDIFTQLQVLNPLELWLHSLKRKHFSHWVPIKKSCCIKFWPHSLIRKHFSHCVPIKRSRCILYKNSKNHQRLF